MDAYFFDVAQAITCLSDQSWIGIVTFISRVLDRIEHEESAVSDTQCKSFDHRVLTLFRPLPGRHGDVCVDDLNDIALLLDRSL